MPHVLLHHPAYSAELSPCTPLSENDHRSSTRCLRTYHIASQSEITHNIQHIHSSNQHLRKYNSTTGALPWSGKSIIIKIRLALWCSVYISFCSKFPDDLHKHLTATAVHQRGRHTYGFCLDSQPAFCSNSVQLILRV